MLESAHLESVAQQAVKACRVKRGCRRAASKPLYGHLLPQRYLDFAGCLPERSQAVCHAPAPSEQDLQTLSFWLLLLHKRWCGQRYP